GIYQPGGSDMDIRELKALEIAARVPLVWKRRVCFVPSQSGNGVKYKVERTLYGFTCTCDDHQLRQQDCKHIIAARLVWERDGGEKALALDTDSVPKRPTYKQNWVAYNQAQQQEKDRVQILLADLCSGVVDPPNNKRPGPLRVPLADRLFAVCLKVWSTLSSRRFNCDLEEAHRRGHLSRSLHPNKVNCYMEEEELAPHLRALIVRSALPLRAVETEFAVDSSGFSTSRFVRWFDCKHGVE